MLLLPINRVTFSGEIPEFSRTKKGLFPACAVHSLSHLWERDVG